MIARFVEHSIVNWLNVWWFNNEWKCYKDKCKNRCRNRCKSWYRYENWRDKEFDRCEFDWCDWWDWTRSFSLRCVFFQFVLSISNNWKQFTIISFHISDLFRWSILTKWFFNDSMHQFSFDLLTIRMRNSIFLCVANRVDEISDNRCETISVIRDQIEEIMKHCIVQSLYETGKRLLMRYRTGSRVSSWSARLSLESLCPGYSITVKFNSRHQLAHLLQ
jgi:hypothetical protein